MNAALSAGAELSVQQPADDCIILETSVNTHTAHLPATCERIKLEAELETDLDADRRRIFPASHIATSTTIRSSTRAPAKPQQKKTKQQHRQRKLQPTVTPSFHRPRDGTVSAC